MHYVVISKYKTMTKHKTIDNEELGNRLCEEMDRASDVRILSLIIHLYIEYYLNELIRLKFDEGKFILNRKELGSFYNKCLILRALGVFKQKDKLLRNIKLITNIRNYYAHHTLLSDEVPEENKIRIKQLVCFDHKGNEMEYVESDYEEPGYILDVIKFKLQICGMETLNVLERMTGELEAMKISKP